MASFWTERLPALWELYFVGFLSLPAAERLMTTCRSVLDIFTANPQIRPDICTACSLHPSPKNL